MSQKNLNLLFPQWQGSGKTKELFYGAQEIQKYFCEKIDFTEVPVSTEGNNEIKNGIQGYFSILAQLRKAHNIIKVTNPKKILTIGGDCGVELAPVSFLNKKYANDLAVVWFDAHGDLNTPEKSLSHHFHGMPLRFLLGAGDQEIIQSCFSTISLNQIILVGGRNFDKAELEFIENKGITSCSISQLILENRSLIELIKGKGFKHLYIHIDLDVLDPKCFPHVKCPTKNGFSLETLSKVLLGLNSEFQTVGSSIVEYSPTRGSGINYIEKLLKISGYL